MVGDVISAWIAERVRKAGSEGAVVGLSGGIDSSVTAVLARRALRDGVLGLMMPCHSHPQDLAHARLVADTFGIRTDLVDLAPAFDAILALLPSGDRLAEANLKARLRMTTLYFCANAGHYLVLGTSNRSELEVGYFTKYGDGGADILPLGGLLKRQVRELARELGVPQPIIDKPPSGGLWPGQTDEGEMGITYDEIDEVLSRMDGGDVHSLSTEVLTKVLGMMDRSAHKRVMPPICPLA